MDLASYTFAELEQLQEKIQKENRRREIVGRGLKELSTDLRSLVYGHVPLHLMFNRETYELQLSHLENGSLIKPIRLDWRSSWERALEDLRKSKQLKCKTSLYIGEGKMDHVHRIRIFDNVWHILDCVSIFENLVELHLIDLDQAYAKIVDLRSLKENIKQPWPQMPTLKVFHLKQSLLFMTDWIGENIENFPFSSLETCILEQGEWFDQKAWSTFLQLTSDTLKFLTVTHMRMTYSLDPLFQAIINGPELSLRKLHMTRLDSVSKRRINMILDIFKKTPQLEDLDLTHNHFDQSDIELIQENLPSSTTRFYHDFLPRISPVVPICLMTNDKELP